MPILHLSGIDFHIFVGGGGGGGGGEGVGKYWVSSWYGSWYELETNQMECVCQM